MTKIDGFEKRVRLGGGGHFTPGFWRPDKSSGKNAVPEGPQQALPVRADRSFDDYEQRVREATAKNIAERETALAPRRWTGGKS